MWWRGQSRRAAPTPRTSRRRRHPRGQQRIRRRSQHRLAHQRPLRAGRGPRIGHREGAGQDVRGSPLRGPGRAVTEGGGRGGACVGGGGGRAVMEPRIQYVKTSDGVNIAYWTLGKGEPFII